MRERTLWEKNHLFTKGVSYEFKFRHIQILNKIKYPTIIQSYLLIGRTTRYFIDFYLLHLLCHYPYKGSPSILSTGSQVKSITSQRNNLKKDSHYFAIRYIKHETLQQSILKSIEGKRPFIRGKLSITSVKKNTSYKDENYSNQRYS